MTQFNIQLAPVISEPIELSVARTGLYQGKAAYLANIFGFRTQWNSTTVMGDCCAYLAGGQDQMNTPAVGTTYYINSTSVQDLTAGTGVDRVLITYLDSNGLTQTVTASLNGTTAVSIGTGFSFIQYMETYHSTTANRVPAGNVTISSINGAATEATTMEMVLAGGNKSQSLRFQVPSDSVAYLIRYSDESASATFDTKLRATMFTNDGLSTSFQFVDTAALGVGAAHASELGYLPLPSGTTLKLSAIPSAKPIGNILTGSLYILIAKK